MNVAKDKFINFKISQNGKFQITGCKNEDHAIFTVKTFWNYVKKFKELNIDDENYIYKKEGNFRSIFMTVMTNIDFNVGFLINREKLDKLINSDTDFKSLLETSFGYTGVNIKFPMQKEIDHKLPYMEIADDDEEEKVSDKTYTDYIGFLEENEKKEGIK